MKIAIANLTGNCGKSTLRRHLFVPLLPNARAVTVEDINDGDGAADEEYSSREFRTLAASLNVSAPDENLVIDIGASNLRESLGHLGALATTRDLIDFWVLPCGGLLKQRNDTVETIKRLVHIGVEPTRIRVLSNAVEDLHSAGSLMRPLVEGAEAIGYQVGSAPVLYSDIFQLLKDRPGTVFDVAADKTDFRSMASAMRGDAARLADLGRAMVARDLARAACLNLRAAFEGLNLRLEELA